MIYPSTVPLQEVVTFTYRARVYRYLSLILYFCFRYSLIK